MKEVRHCHYCSTSTARVYHGEGKHLKNEIRPFDMVPLIPSYKINRLATMLREYSASEVALALKARFNEVELRKIWREIEDLDAR